jgi:quercetin dioxygenase-like cupin family protein
MGQQNTGIEVTSFDEADRLESPLGGAAVFRLGYPEEPMKPGIMHVRIAPGQVSPVHRHKSWTSVIVLEGAIRVGGVRHAKGAVLMIEPNIWYGPLEAEAPGAEILEIHATQPGGEPIWQEMDDDRVRGINAYLARVGRASWKE